VEVARWLLQEQPLWVDLGRLFARETRAFDVLSRLPNGSEKLPTLDDVSRLERNPTFDGAVVDAVTTRSTSWLAAALLSGGDPNTSFANELEWTVLCFAAWSGHEDGVRLLRQFGADPNKEGSRGMSALAKGAEYPRIVRLLLEKGANPNAGNRDGWYGPLSSAALAGSIESLQLLLARCGDANRVNAWGESVLHSAVFNSNAECCRELLVHGADPCGEEDGSFLRDTPMHIIARYPFGHEHGMERAKILDVLLEAGASLLAVNVDGFTPGQLALRSQGTSEAVREWFSRHEAV
jgi:ankyrin repeat protein